MASLNIFFVELSPENLYSLAKEGGRHGPAPDDADAERQGDDAARRPGGAARHVQDGARPPGPAALPVRRRAHRGGGEDLLRAPRHEGEGGVDGALMEL